MSSTPGQPGHLTLTELVANYAIYSGVGFLMAGWPGVWSGVGLFTVVFVAAMIVALLRHAHEQDPSQRTRAEPLSWPTDLNNSEPPGSG